MSPDDLTDAAASADAPTESAEEILHTDNLVKAYRGRRVVDQVSLSVREGEIVGLLGPNGAGKTTTFRMVVGMVTPDKGSVMLNGEDVTKQPMYRRARRGLGYLAQQESVFKKMSAIDNIRCVLEARGMKRSDREERARAVEATEQRLSTWRADSELARFAATRDRGARARHIAGDDIARRASARSRPRAMSGRGARRCSENV